MTSYTDPRGIVTLYAYDAAGRLTQVDYPAGTLPDLQFSYDTTELSTGQDCRHHGRYGQLCIRLCA